jgi:26S proteasome regulatory subunit N3
VGKIKAIQLEYSEAQASLIQSLRKGPEIGATGFRVTVQKLLVIVELLMGEIPNRQIFSHTDYEKPLGPYFSIVSCVKSGDMERFKHLCVKYAKLFKADKNLSLIHRLQHTVIKFGLKKINISYSRISLQDIQ